MSVIEVKFKFVSRLLSGLMLGAVMLSPAAIADMEETLREAMNSPERSQADKDRDRNRKPIETLQFFQLEPDMRVLEIIPGGGWYTQLLAPVLADEGKLFAALGTGRIKAMQDEGKLTSVEILDVSSDAIVREEGDRRIGLKDFKLDVKNIDLVLTFRNLHNLNEAGRKAMNDEMFRVLKKGGLYGVVDHTRRHMQSDSSENWRRMDPVLAIKEIEASGFEFVDFSDLHYRYDDELVYEVGRRSVSGNTDRFTLLFRKP